MECKMFTLLLKNYVKTILLLLVCITPALSFAAAAPATDTAVTAKVKESMRAMKAWARIMGEAKLEGEERVKTKRISRLIANL